MRAILLLLLLLPAALIAQPQSSRERRELALGLMSHGQDKMDAGDYAGAADDFLRARKLDPQNVNCAVKLAQAWYLTGEFAKSANVMKGIIKTRKASPQAFQVYGNAMDALGKSGFAMNVYREGLKKFPAAAVLHMEVGIMHFSEGRIDSALHYWEDGIEADHWFAANYYWAARACDSLGDRLWASLYAEFYMNLDRVGPRSREMGQLLFDCYRRSVTTDSMGLPAMNFFDRAVPTARAGLSFEQLSQETFTLALREPGFTFTVENLISAWDFYHHFWLRDRQSADFHLSLTEWHKEIDEHGLLEAYHHWLLYDTAPNEFIAWVSENDGYWQEFEEWFGLNSISMLGKGYLCRRQFHPDKYK